MGKANGVSVRRAQRGQQSGELPVAGRMNPLEETPVPAGREQHVFGVWQTRRPAATHHAHRQVLVDHDHSEIATRASVRVVAAAKDRIRCEIRVKCGLKLVRKISGRHPGEHRPPFFGQARVSCPTASAALFRNFDDGHLPISVSLWRAAELQRLGSAMDGGGSTAEEPDAIIANWRFSVV